jgi:hypothetical protein
MSEEENPIFKNAPIKIKKKEEQFDVLKLSKEGTFSLT